MPDPKRLLSARFANVTGTLQYNLGCNSSDNIPIPSPNPFIYSGTKQLNQVGCNFIVPDSRNASYTQNHLTALYSCFNKAGYGIRNPFCPNVFSKNIPMYLNGTAVLDGVAMPYLQWEDGSYSTILVYYRADGTRLGQLWGQLIGTGGANYCSFIAGQLYVDGTFRGCAGPVRHHTIIGGLDSTKYYEWLCTDKYDDYIQILNNAIVEDLAEYLPIEPEGEFTDNGNGDFDSTSDPIDFPDLPNISVLDTGMTQIYEMTAPQLRSLSNYLWTSNFATNIEKMFNDPMEAIINLCIAPLDLTDGALSSHIRIGNITTSVTGQRIASPYKIINCGLINMNEYWASFADYSPYTKLSIFLPYVGVQHMSIDDVMNGTIELKAYCDVLTGSVQYVLKSRQGNRRGHGHNSVLYTWGGNLQYQLPLNASNMSSVVSSIISTTGTIAGAVGSAVATGGMTAPIALGTAGSAMSNVMNAKTHIQRGGGIGGSVGLFGVQTPYLILERPEQITPPNYKATIGSPAETTDYPKNYAGFIKIKGVNLSINGATENELNELETILKGGVLI